MLMFITTSWAEEATIAAVVAYACFYGGFGQMVAGVFEVCLMGLTAHCCPRTQLMHALQNPFTSTINSKLLAHSPTPTHPLPSIPRSTYFPTQLIKGNTFAGTAFFSYGAFWMAFFVMKHLIKTTVGSAAPYSSHFQVGETLIMVLWGLFTTAFFVPTLRKNGCLMFVFGSLSVTFFLLAGGQWSKTCLQAAGYVGFVCGCSAIYTAFAEIWQESLGFNMPGLRPVRFI